jgi:hypothetical protein
MVSLTPLPLSPRGKSPGTHWIGGWVRPIARLDDVEKRKFLHIRESKPGRPARSKSLYRLNYPDSPSKDMGKYF